MNSMTKFFALFLLLIFSTLQVFSAQGDTVCGTTNVQRPANQIGGAYVSATGTLKVLFIFIDFPDDNFDVDNPTWPMDKETFQPIGPNYLSQIVDETEAQNSGNVNNVTTFFNNMSFNQFKMIGKAYYKQAPHSLAWYKQNHPGSESAYSAQDAIQALDATVDFSDFDRWNDGVYSHTPNSPDGVIDMVFICYRDWYINQGNFGSSFIAEGWWGASLPSDVYVDGGVRKITSTHAVDVLRMSTYPNWGTSMQNVVHEFGHVWGLDHQYAPGLWSLMGQRGPSTSSFMNALEREQLGWVNFNTITSTTTFTLPDFGSTGTAYRVQIPGTSEYYILENHQKLTTYDVPDLTSGGQGLYILLNASGNVPGAQGNMRVFCADGRWNWSVTSWIQNPFGYGTDPRDILPVYQRGAVNSTTGSFDRDNMNAVNVNSDHSGWKAIWVWLDEVTGALKSGQRFKGDGKDSWNLTNNAVFSPYSNPAATKANNTTTPVVIEVQGQSGSVLTVKVYINDTLSSAPSKPQNPKVEVYTGGGDWNPKITWAAMQEPDVTTGGSIYIERCYKLSGGNWSGWSTIATLSGTASSYIDQIYTQSGSGNDSLKYRVRAKDSQNKYSVYSDEAKINFMQNAQKRGFVDNTPSDYVLSQNYPNPFNPSTTIKYEIPADENVVIKVFNLLGKEVATLVNGFKTAGYYEANFDASSLSSGIYIYRLTAGKYSETRKMTLMK